MDTKYLPARDLGSGPDLGRGRPCRGAAGYDDGASRRRHRPARGRRRRHDGSAVQRLGRRPRGHGTYGPGGEEIGEVEEVLADGSGQPVAVAAEVGGFLGVGERSVTIALDQLRLDGEHLVSGLTKEQLEALPEWEDD